MQTVLSQCHSILLLGEANFSFSVSLKKLLPATVAMVTSCLQGRQQLPGDDGRTETNIGALVELGVRVLFGVDATRLDDCPALEGALFDAVVFNFPHVGGKGNIGRNRELLKRFFMCCPNLLASDGRVLVTLCSGQGGTPADRPQRKWQDSWQVVAMATYGSLVLTGTVPFHAGDYGDYYCTGYRSQSKQFLTRDAVTHVFERGASALPDAPTPNERKRVDLRRGPNQNVTVTCPTDLTRNIERNLLEEENHPLYHLSQDLRKLLEASIPSCHVMPSTGLPLLLRSGEVITFARMSPSELYALDSGPAEMTGDDAVLAERTGTQLHIQTDKECPLSLPSGDVAEAVDRVISDQPFASSDDAGEKSDPFVDGVSSMGMFSQREEVLGGEACRGFVLRPNLLCHIPQIVLMEHTSPFVAFGNVFRRCGIGVTEYPIMHQCLVVFPPSSGTDSLWDSRARMLAAALSTLLEGRGKVVIRESPDEHGGKVGRKSFLLLEMDDSNHSDANPISIGHQGVFHSSKGDVSYCLLDIDTIAMIRYGVEDIRLFWSSDERSFSNFRTYAREEETNQKDVQNLGQSRKLHGYSLYAPVYTHDVSFWLLDDSFDERLFCSVVRSVTFDLVREVRFLNQYVNQKVSYTYRLVYQSCDSAISKQAAMQLQSSVRAAISEWLAVETR